MIVFKRFPLRNADPDTAGTGLNLEPEADNGDPTLDASGDGEPTSSSTPEDRGDVVADPAPSEQSLRAVAGDEEDPRGNTRPVATDEGDAEPGTRRSPHVPISRFNEVNEAKKQAEAEAERLRQELEQLRAGKPATGTTTDTPAAAPAQAASAEPAFDVEAAEERYGELLADGEFKEAAKLRVQINNEVKSQARAEFEAQQTRRQAEAAAAAEVASAKSIADQAVIDYPYLDTPEGAPAMAAIVTERDRLMRAGQPMAEALQAAVNKFGPIFAGSSQHTPSSVLPTGGKPADTRPAAAAERGARASTQQPAPLTGGMGNAAQATRLDPMTMTEDQFEALSPAEKARLRGD